MEQEPPTGYGTVYMAVHCQGRRVGIAWYDTSTQQKTLSFAPCIISHKAQNSITRYTTFQQLQLQCFEGCDDPIGDSSEYRLINLARLQYAPSVIYVSSRADFQLIDCLKTPVHTYNTSVSGGTENQQGADGRSNDDSNCSVRLERSSLFLPDQARRVFERVYVDTMPHGLSVRDRLHWMNTAINLSSEQQVCAAGALLAILAREDLLSITDDGATSAISVAALKETAIDGFLMIDPTSMEALHIFSTESHPSAMGIGSSKEGLSVFGLLNKCTTPLGRKLLRTWFAAPLVNLDVVKERQDGVEFLIRVADITAPLRTALRQVKGPARQLDRIQATQTLPEADNFVQLQYMIEALFRIRQMLQEMRWSHQPDPNNTSSLVQEHSNTPTIPSTHNNAATLLPSVLVNIGSNITDDLIACHTMIRSIIDPAQVPEGMMLHYGVSEDLDALKQMYYGLPDLLTRAVQEELRRIPRSLAGLMGDAAWSITYMPQVGFIMRVEGCRLSESLEDCLPDYQFAFEGGQGGGDTNDGTCEDAPSWYYHCNCTRELNERFGDILHRIKDMESSLCAQLVKKLEGFGPALRKASAAVAELDCLLSLATAAIELNLTRPTLTSENVLKIKGGRHLITEMLVQDNNYIPNDTCMSTDRDRVHVITGPNFSGKSCYVKQVAIITFLAHVGSFVPAEEAVVGLTDRIFTRVISKEAYAVPQSTFMIDLTQCAAMVKLSTHRSLCIIDELGKGTLASDGIGLLCGVLHHFSSTMNSDDNNSPKVLLCTHFTEVLEPAYLPRNDNLAFFTMSVLEQQEDGEVQLLNSRTRRLKDLVFLYRLVPGAVGPSFGVHCAQLSNMPEEVLQRAQELINNRSEYPPKFSSRLEQRNTVFKGLVQDLAALDVSDERACERFAETVLAATEGM